MTTAPAAGITRKGMSALNLAEPLVRTRRWHTGSGADQSVRTMRGPARDREAPVRPWRDHLPPGMSPEDVALASAGSLVAAWRRRWDDDPGRIVLTDTAGAALTAAALDERSSVAAARLAAAGVRAGDRVVVSADASLDHVVAYVGVLRLGAVALPLNGAYRAPEIRHIVGDAEITAAVTDDVERGRWIAAAAPAAVITPPDLTGLPGPTGVLDGLDATIGDDPALLVYTSGTTGAPKGAVLRHANLLASAEAVALAWRWAPDDRLVLALPLFHMHGLGVGLHGTLTAGASAVLLPRFDPADVLDRIRAGGTMFFGVPTMWHRLAAAQGAEALARLRLGVSGSAPLPPDLHAAVAARAGRPPLERYGMTETVMLVSNPYDGERRPGSVGFPLPGVDVRLADGGEIEVRGPNVFAGYWRRAEATAHSFRDGWFRTGDLGAADPDGYLRIVGRAKELIISGGYNVYPREVEEVLLAHPGVVDSAVVGIPDPEWGETVCAFVAAEPGITDHDLEDWCGSRLAAYKRPRRWERIDEVPRNALGKVLRHALVERL
jgi:malonyl-CoA/methylmalonyl-CoA synthetase